MLHIPSSKRADDRPVDILYHKSRAVMQPKIPPHLKKASTSILFFFFLTEASKLRYEDEPSIPTRCSVTRSAVSLSFFASLKGTSARKAPDVEAGVSSPYHV